MVTVHSLCCGAGLAAPGVQGHADAVLDRPVPGLLPGGCHFSFQSDSSAAISISSRVDRVAAAPRSECGAFLAASASLGGRFFSRICSGSMSSLAARSSRAQSVSMQFCGWPGARMARCRPRVESDDRVLAFVSRTG